MIWNFLQVRTDFFLICIHSRGDFVIFLDFTGFLLFIVFLAYEVNDQFENIPKSKQLLSKNKEGIIDDHQRAQENHDPLNVLL